MANAKKILITVAATTWLLSSGSLVLFAKNKAKQLQGKRVTVGFQTGKSSTLFNNSRPVVSHKYKCGSYNSLLVRMPVSKHFKTEGGITFNTPQSQLFSSKIALNNASLRTPSVSFPLTIQYYPMQHKCRLQPYCGVGVRCCPSPFKTITPSGTYTDAAYNNDNIQSGTKYISIFFAQGVTFEINTRIELTQSFHFIPERNNNSIGFGIGVGYNLQ